jgi:hypothetical protein
MTNHPSDTINFTPNAPVISKTGKLRRRFGTALSAMMVVTTAAPSMAYEPGYPFTQYKNTGYNAKECGSYGPAGALTDSGPVRFSCRVTALSSLWSDPDKIYKFTGIACSRGDNAMEAEYHANSHADEVVHALENDQAKKLGIFPETLKRVKTDTNCVNTSGMTAPGANNNNGQEIVETVDAERRQQIEQEERDREAEEDAARERKADAARAAREAKEERQAAERRRRTATFIMNNNDKYSLGLSFYPMGVAANGRAMASSTHLADATPIILNASLVKKSAMAHGVTIRT